MSIVALVEPDEAIRIKAARALRDADLSVIEALDGLDALRATFTTRPQAIVMDLQAQGIDGLELVRVLRAACDVPIIVLTADPRPQITVRVLDHGADDVLDRACSETELVARVRAAIRRYERQPSEPAQGMVVRTGSLVIDRESQIVTKDGEPVSLSRTEYRLIDALASRLGQVAPHRFLLSTVWGDAYVDDTHYLRVYIGYLRNKLEDVPAGPRYIINEWGLGYRLMALPVGAPVWAGDRDQAPRSNRVATAVAAVAGD
jgi:two-component system, OmpR family, KDP operon response regulator KdpE